MEAILGLSPIASLREIVSFWAFISDDLMEHGDSLR